MATAKSVKRRPVRTAQLGAIYTFQVPNGAYGACQVLATEVPLMKGFIEIAALDYLGTSPLAPGGAAKLRVLRQDWGNFQGTPARLGVPRRVPWWALEVEVTDLVERFKEPCTSFGGWRTHDAYLRSEWTRCGYRPWRHNPREVDVDLGAGSARFGLGASQVMLGPAAGEPGTIPAPERGVRFEALDVLPSLGNVIYRGSDPAFARFLSNRPLGEAAWLAHGQREIDLRASVLQRFTIEVGDDPVLLRAPTTLLELTVRGPADRLTVEGARVGFPFELRLEGPRLSPPPRGCEAIESVTFSGLRTTDSAALAAYPKLAELELRGAPGRGRLIDASGLRHVESTLRELTAYEMFGLDSARWPIGWAALEGVTIHGLRKVDADVLKRTFARVSEVKITGARTDEWLAANLTNPFREWGDDDPAFGRAACAAWKKAQAAAGELGAGAAPSSATAVLRELVESLNRLHAKFDIDTIRREEAAEAFFALASELGAPTDQAASWFDEWRDF